MPSKKYSYSRLGTYKDCKRKYYLKYIEGWGKKQVTVAVTAKGLAFHEFAEHYESSWDEAKVLAEIAAYEAKYPEGAEYYPLEPKVRKFIDLHKAKILPFEKTGKIEKETWLNGIIRDENFCGAIDLLIEHGDGTADIIDYKSAKTASASSYKGQLLLYAYMYAKMKGIEIPEVKEKTDFATEEEYKTYKTYYDANKIEDKISLAVFFPFSIGETYDKCLKKIKYTSEDIYDNIKKIEEEVDSIKSEDWSKNDPTDVNLKPTCSWCDFLGHPEYCPITYKAGWRVERGTTFEKR